MFAPNASSSSSQLISYVQDIDYTRSEGFKWFKSHYNVKNTRAACNDPNGTYLSAETVFQAVKGLGCTLHSFNGLSLDDFISSGSVAACRCLKHLSLAPLLHGSNEAMHTEVGQARRPGAKLGDNQYMLSVGGDRWYQFVRFDGRCPVHGRSNCGSALIDDQLI